MQVLVPHRATSNYSASSAIHESKFGKRHGDSAFGQPRSDPASPKRIKLNDQEGILHQPTFPDTDQTSVKILDTEMYPVLTQHFVYPFMNNGDPTLIVKIMDKNISMLLDTEAHVSVLPKNVAQDIIALPSEGHGNRHCLLYTSDAADE